MKKADSLGDANRRNWHVRTVAEIIGAVILLSGGAAAASAVAAPSAKGTTIHACENNKSGVLSVLRKAGGTCPKGTKPLSWNTTGPRGPAGTTALFGKNTNEAKAGSSGSDGALHCLTLRLKNHPSFVFRMHPIDFLQRFILC